jgi:hypothetical protein
MQVHGPSVVLKQPRQEIRATLIERKFVRLSVGPIDIHVQTAEEADILIAAAAEAKRLLDPPVPGCCDCMADAGCYDITGRTA